MSSYLNQKGPGVGKGVWEIINFDVLTEVVLVIDFCLSFHKNKSLSYSQAEIFSQGNWGHPALYACTQPSMLINNLCVCVWNAG